MSKFAEDALRDCFDASGEWAFCFKCRRPFLTKGELERCDNCNKSLAESVKEYEKEVVRFCKLEAEAIADLEAKKLTKGAKDKWPKNATSANVSKVVYDIFTTFNKHADELVEWDEDKHGSIVEAMEELNDFYASLSKPNKMQFLLWVRPPYANDCHDMYGGVEHLFSLQEKAPKDDIAAPPLI